MSSLLDKLGTVGTAKRPAKGTVKAIINVPGLHEYGAAGKIAKEITDGFLKTSPVKDTVTDHFVESMIETGRAPDSISGEDGRTTASLQPRKRNSNSPLSADVVARCVDLGITVEHFVVVPGAVIVNPKYMDQTASLEQLLAMAKKAGFPEDFFAMQTEVSKELACDETIADIAKLAKGGKITPIVARELFEGTTSLTVVAKWGGSLTEALEIVNEQLVPDEPVTVKPAPVTVLATTGDAFGLQPTPPKSGLMDALKASLATEAANEAAVTNVKRRKRA